MDDATDRVLRGILVYSFAIALCFLIPYGTRSGQVTLSLGCIPAFFSAIIGLIGLGKGLRKRCVAIPFDALLLAFHLGIFIPGVIFLSKSGSDWRGSRNVDAGVIMLGTYATLPLMADICVHAYCILRHLPIPGIGKATCPNCQHEHTIRPHFHFSHPSVGFPPSTIFTPEDDDDASEAAGVSQYDDRTVGRPSSDLDGATIIGEPRLNQPLLSESKANGRLV